MNTSVGQSTTVEIKIKPFLVVCV